MDKSLRIIDANLNRAREGLRTAEEYARFVLNDARSAQALKDARRQIQGCAESFGPGLLAARDIVNDVGARPEADDVARATEQGVAAAGLKRAQEALRVIEEFAQLHSPAAAAAAAKARYSAYAAEQQLFVNAPRRAVLRESPVMALFSGTLTRDDWRDVLKSLLNRGARLFQLREKDRTTAEFKRFAEAFINCVEDYNALVVINDRTDVAYSVSAHGVHLGQDDLPPEDGRKILGPVALIGVSTHNLTEAKDAEQMGADYVGLGAMFHTQTKKVQSMAGPSLVSQVQPEIQIPVFCIGGINRANVAELVGHGARHIAVSSALLNAPDPGAEYKLLVDALGERA
ncbi:MAG: thiamine phosphate synthase [Planctomycetes bacterium]|nr:thiamine phosphate synthase [Planctomycetota bacterium]